MKKGLGIFMIVSTLAYSSNWKNIKIFNEKSESTGQVSALTDTLEGFIRIDKEKEKNYLVVNTETKIGYTKENDQVLGEIKVDGKVWDSVGRVWNDDQTVTLEINDEILEAMKKGLTLEVSVKTTTGKKATYKTKLIGFTEVSKNIK